MKKIKNKSWGQEFLQFLKKDVLQPEDLVFEQPIADNEWPEILRGYGRTGTAAVIVLKSGQRKKGKIARISEKERKLELDNGETLNFDEVSRIE
jgi:hypothetical protein